MRGLYAIIDVQQLEQRGLEVGPFAAAVLQARPTALQLRDKRQRARETLALLEALRQPTRAAGTLLFANDRPDLAALAGCDGVHLGRRDLALPLARQVLASAGLDAAVIGASVHNEEELQQALQEAPDYLAFGPVYATASKADPEPTLGLAGLAALTASAARRAGPMPFVAIGGITHANATDVARHCGCAAVIGGLLPAGDSAAAPYADVAERAAALQRAIAGQP